LRITSAASRATRPTNLKPVGTGPYLFVDFKPADVVRAKLNPDYHVPNRPYFDTLEVKGGGDAVSAARAVLQTGEYDYAWNMQVEDEILLKLESAGKGKVSIVESGNVEFIMLNSTDPAVEVDGERASLKTRHPLFSDLRIQNSNSTSRRPTRFSKPPAGKRAPTAFAPRMANR
jgi:peptide/nickel transport system substrate-binding protein